MRREKIGLGVDLSQFLEAQVVASAFHIADRQLAIEYLLDEGNILEKKLLLKVLGASGDDDFLAAGNGGQ